MVALVVALVAAACGSDPDGEDPVEAAAPPEPTAAPTTVDDEPDADTTIEGPDPGALSAVAADGWSVVLVGEGTKPDLALDPDGVPGVAFLFENLPEGYVSYASAADGWTVDRVVEGYFYGPIGLDYDTDGGPHIAYHDHQDMTFRDNLGDLTYARRVGDAWETQIAASDGHDGWDSTIRVGDDGTWTHETVDADGDVGRFSSFAYDAGGTAHIAYWHLDTGEVRYATDASGAWVISTVATLDGVEIGFEGARRITSLALDPDGVPQIAYSDVTGVWIASPDGEGTWTSQPVIEAGARPLGQLVSLAVDGAGQPHLALFEVTGNGPLSGLVAYATPAG